MSQDFSSIWFRIDVRNDMTDEELRQMVAGTGGQDAVITPAFVLAMLRPMNGAIGAPRAALQIRGQKLIAALEQDQFQDLESRLREHQSSAPTSFTAQRLFHTMLQIFLEDLDAVLRRAREVLTQSQSEVHSLIQRLDSQKAAGVADLPALSQSLLNVTDLLSLANNALEAQTVAARWLRRHVAATDFELAAELDDLVAAQQQAARFIEFLSRKQRLLEGSAGQSVAMSDMNVTKIFTILWTIFIPGTAIINWYGQNFKFMPELSWYYSLWVQLGTAFLLTVIPVYVVLRSGALR